MIEDIFALGGGFDHQDETVFDFLLAAELGEDRGTEGDVEGGFGGGGGFGVEIIAHGSGRSWREWDDETLTTVISYQSDLLTSLN